MRVKGKIVGQVNLQILSGLATPAPPIGTSLGPRGINLVEFCKLFNKKTENMEKGTPVSTVVVIYSDKSFTFIIREPPVSYLLKKASGIDKGSRTPGHGKSIGRITMDQILNIAELKKSEINASNLDKTVKTVIGTARSLGLDVF